MSIESDAAKAHIESLFKAEYPCYIDSPDEAWQAEYEFAKLDMNRKWRFDYADHIHRCAIELDGGTFQAKRTGHASGTGLRAWREKNNAAMAAGWRVWHYAPEEVIKAGRKTLPDEPILTCLPWLAKREIQQPLTDSPANLSGFHLTPRPNYSSAGVFPDSAKGETV